MRLRRRMMLAVVVTAIILTATTYQTLEVIRFGAIRQQEINDARRNSDIILSMLKNDLQALASACEDWAYWDDTYRFVETGDQSYISQHLGEEALRTLRIDFILFIRGEREIIYAEWAGEDSSDDLGWLKASIAMSHSGWSRAADGSSKGIVKYGDASALVAIYPVLTSARQGPIAGMLAMGRILDEAAITALGEKAHTHLRYGKPSQSAAGLSDNNKIRLEAGSESWLYLLGPEASEISLKIADLSGSDPVWLTIRQRRELNLLAREASRHIVIALLILSAAFGLITMRTLDSMFLSRLKGISQAISKVSGVEEVRVAVPVEGDDEIRDVALALSSMLSRLDESSKAVVARRRAELLNRVQRDLSIAISRTNDVEQALNEIPRAVVRLDDVDSSVICLGKNVCTFKSGWPEGEVPCREQPLYTHSSKVGPIPSLEVDGKALAIGFIPIQHESLTIACLGVASNTVDEFDEATRESLESIVSHAAAAVARIAALTESRQSQESLELFSDTLDQIVLVLLPQGHILSKNPEAVRLLGYTDRDLSLMTVFDLLPANEQELARHMLTRPWAAGASRFSLIRKDKSLIPVEVRCARGRWEQREALFFIARDITRQQQAEQTIRLAHDVIASSSSVLMRRELPGLGRVLFVTHNVSQWGYDPEAILSGQVLYSDMVHPDDVVWLEQTIEQNLKAGLNRFSCAYRIRGKDGATHFVEEQSAIERPEDADDARWIQAVVNDVTEKRLVEEQEAHMVDMSRAIEEISHSVGADMTIQSACLASLGLTGSDTSVFWEVQPDAVDLLSLEPTHVFGGASIDADALRASAQSWWDQRTAPAAVDTVLMGQEQRHCCYSRVQSSQTRFGLLIVMSEHRYKDEPKVLRTMAVLGYVTSAILERQQSETLHRRLAVAEEQARIASEIHDSVSQSLFSLVYGLQGAIASLDAGSKEDVKSKLQMLRNIAASVSREIRSSIYRLSETSSDGAFVQAVRSYLGELAEIYDIKTSLSVNGSEDNLSPAVRRAVWRVVREATSNALRHGKCTLLHVSLSMNPFQTIAEIRDNGIGFTPPHSEHLLGSAVPSLVQGGLGLVSMANLARSFDGSLAIESEPGKGTALTIRIPDYERDKRSDTPDD